VTVPAGRLVVAEAGRTGLVWAVADDGRLHQIGFGAGGAGPRPELPVGLYPLAHPTFGEEPLREPALRITHADGATSTRLAVVEVADPVPAPRGGGLEHRVVLADRVAPVRVTLVVRTWPEHDLLEQWTEVENQGPGSITLHQVCGSAPAFAGANPHLTHWGGGWAGEWTETTERLTAGTKTVASAGGVRPSLYRPPVVLLAPGGPVTETEGTVGAATVVWGGDVRFDAEVFLHGLGRLLAGHQHRGSERRLDAGDRFESPHVLWTWSDEGVGATSRALHRFVREQVVRDGDRLRATVVNTWEAVGFALDPEGLGAQVDRASGIGGELFLLDDGWFGDAHPRDDDTTGLGDWVVDRRKLPDGLQPVIDHTLAAGLRFGLWVEPEMVNPRSALYEAHPDWVIAEPGRDRREERQQLVLDLCRPEVRAFVVDTIDRILSDHSGITYLKWDANRDITEPGSTVLPADRQTHLPLDRVSATWDVMAEVARRHPDLELMLCASGGGRSDLGTLRWFHELWTSDNTDPVDRVRIQWGASHLLPASVLAAHVTRWGQRPLAFAAAVALSGRFGFDLDLRGLTDDELATCRRAGAAAARIRPTVQHGDLHRLVSPVGSDRAALAYVHDADRTAVVFAYRLPGPAGEAGSGAGDPPIDAAAFLPSTARSGTLTAVDLTPDDDPRPSELGPGGTVPWPEGPVPAARVVELRW
jgi:alpha-galactosidase